MDAITTSSLTKHYGATRAVVDLDLTVEQGEVFGFLGPNGAGKTTTIRLLMGLLNPTSGRAEVLGGDPRRDAIEIHRRVGYLPSDPAFPVGPTGRVFLDHLARLRGGVGRKRVEHLADRFDVDLGKPISRMSRGNRQKVGILQAFMHEPELVILDEASSGLDPLKQVTLNRLVRETADTGRTVFLSSHLIAEVEEVADRVGIVRSGALVALEQVEALKARAVRRTEIRFAHAVDPAPFSALPGVSEVEQRGRTLSMVVAGSMDQLVKTAARFDVDRFTSDEADLSQVFLTYYRDPAHPYEGRDGEQRS